MNEALHRIKRMERVKGSLTGNVAFKKICSG
jgi:hypothetical protein